MFREILPKDQLIDCLFGGKWKKKIILKNKVKKKKVGQGREGGRQGEGWLERKEAGGKSKVLVMWLRLQLSRSNMGGRGAAWEANR